MQDEWKARPWYAVAQEWLAEADRYWSAIDGLGSGPLAAELQSMTDYQVARVVFESNRMERAGLSEGETRKLIDAALLEPASELDLDSTRAQVLRYTNAPAYRFEGRSLSERQVLQHMVALYGALVWGQECHNAVFHRPETPAGSKHLASFTPELLCGWHKRLADGLLDEDAGTAAGVYRTDTRIVEGADVVFPAPDNIPACMSRYCGRARQLLQRESSPWYACAAISYELVRIHPFPDFNGRLSRIVLNLVLRAMGVPFPIALKSDAKGKNRYYRSLRLANAGDLKPYGALVAKHFVECCEAIDANLARAGSPTLESKLEVDDNSLHFDDDTPWVPA